MGKDGFDEGDVDIADEAAMGEVLDQMSRPSLQ
jgi:hypothetical protein